MEDFQPIQLGDLSLIPIFTPGHSPGALSWQWQSCDKTQCLDIVYADSLSPVSAESYRFSAHLAYLQAYRTGVEKLAKLECDILLAPHPSSAKMPKKLLSEQGLPDSKACQRYANKIQNRIEKRLKKEKQAAANEF